MSMVKEIIDHIILMLGGLEHYISISNNQGFIDINVACENLVLGMMNIIYDYKLENYNSKYHKANAKGIDLIDNERKICVQVSSNCHISKLKETIKKTEKTRSLYDYNLKFFALTNKANNLRKYQNDNDLKIKFNAEEDVIDFSSFISDIKMLGVDKIETLNAFLSSWLGDKYHNSFSFKEGIENQQESFERPKDYYIREISILSNDNFPIDRYIHPEKYKSHTLVEYIQNKVVDYRSRYWLLIAAGQTGKSYEVKNLAFLLSQTDDIFPVVFNAKHFKDRKQKIKIPFYYLEEHIVLIIDGIDEILGDELREAFYDQVSNLKSKWPKLRILMTCRRNYIDDSKFKDFKRLFLNDLSFTEIRKIVYDSNISSPDDFLNKIEDKTLYSIAGNPFFLKAMMQYYEQKKEFQDNRLELYHFLIDSSYNAENVKKKGRLIDRKTDGDIFLKKIALVLQFTEQESISELELKRDMHLDNSEIELCMSYAIFYRDESHNYSFEINSFQMYYVVDFLMDQSYDAILQLISYSEYNVPRIRPKWYDVFELLLSSMDIEDKRRKRLLEWTFKNDIETLLNVDPNSLDDAFKDKVFKTILQDYKEKQITSSPNMGIDFFRKLAALCTTEDSLQFFITEYRNEQKFGPYLYLLSFIYWSIDSRDICLNECTEDFKTATYNYLKKFGVHNDTKWYETLYIPFHNDIFFTKIDIEELIKLTKIIDDIELKICIFRLIEKTGLCDDFFSFTISNESKIKNYQRKGDCVTIAVDRSSVIYALTHIKKYENVKILWKNYGQFIIDDYEYHTEDVRHKFRSDMLKLAENHLCDHPDIVEDIKQAWICECEKDHLAYSPNSFIIDFRDFFIRNKLCNNLNDLCERLYKELQNEDVKYNTLEQLYAEIFLIITVEDINALAEKWDATDIYRCKLMIWLSNIPIPEINNAITKLIDNKFVQAKSEKMPTFEQINLERLTQIFNREQFNSIISSIINRFLPINSKDLIKKIREDKKVGMNLYILQYFYKFLDKKSAQYNLASIRESLKDDATYYDFILNIVLQNGKVKFTPSQMRIIGDALRYFESNQKNIGHLNGFVQLVLRFDVNLNEDSIINLLPYYAGVSYCPEMRNGKKIYFIDYVEKKLGKEWIKGRLPELISNDLNKYRELNLIKYSELIVRLRMRELYPYVCKQIKKDYNLGWNLVRILLEDKNFGIKTLKHQFTGFSSDIQIFILEELSKIQLQRDWVLKQALKFREFYSLEEKKRILLLLLTLGYDKALDECIEYLEKDIIPLSISFKVSLLSYANIKYLPKILTLLRIVWNNEKTFNNWSIKINNLLIKMAANDIEQYKIVMNALCKMKTEDNKYISNLNYFIDELKKYDPRIKKASISIANALKRIDIVENK